MIVYEIDYIKKQEVMEKYFGKRLTITDWDNWKTEEILGAYYEQDCIEKIFRDTKDTKHFSLRPIYHWTDQKIRIHIFICLLGLTLTTALLKELQVKGIHVSKNKLMESLSQIRQCWVKDVNSNKVVKVLEEIDEQVSIIWNVINSL